MIKLNLSPSTGSYKTPHSYNHVFVAVQLAVKFGKQNARGAISVAIHPLCVRCQNQCRNTRPGADFQHLSRERRDGSEYK